MGISTIVTSFARGRQYGIITPKVQIENMTWARRSTFVLTPTAPPRRSVGTNAVPCLALRQRGYRAFRVPQGALGGNAIPYQLFSSLDSGKRPRSWRDQIVSPSRHTSNRSTVNPVPIAVEPKRLISWDYSQDIDSL